MSDVELARAKDEAARARARIASTAGALKQRLSPANLTSEAKEKVREKAGIVGAKAGRTIRKRPAASTVAATLAALIVFRKPLGKLRRALFGRKEKAEAAAPRKSSDTIRAGNPPAASITPRIERAVGQSNAAANSKE